MIREAIQHAALTLMEHLARHAGVRGQDLSGPSVPPSASNGTHIPLQLSSFNGGNRHDPFWGRVSREATQHAALTPLEHVARHAGVRGWDLLGPLVPPSAINGQYPFSSVSPAWNFTPILCMECEPYPW